MPSSGSRPGTLRSSSATARGTFSMAADTRGQFHEWSKEQYVVRNSRCPLKLLPNNAPTLTRELSALSTSQTSRNEKVPRSARSLGTWILAARHNSLSNRPSRSLGNPGVTGSRGRDCFCEPPQESDKALVDPASAYTVATDDELAPKFEPRRDTDRAGSARTLDAIAAPGATIERKLNFVADFLRARDPRRGDERGGRRSARCRVA